MAAESNTFPFFIAAGILCFTGMYFYISGLPKGAVVMESAALVFLTIGFLLRRHYRTTK